MQKMSHRATSILWLSCKIFLMPLIQKDWCLASRNNNKILKSHRGITVKVLNCILDVNEFEFYSRY